jgi:hypothetical protein
MLMLSRQVGLRHIATLMVTATLALAPAAVVNASPVSEEIAGQQTVAATVADAATVTARAVRWRCGKRQGSFQVRRCVKFLGTDWNDAAGQYSIYLRNRQRTRQPFYCEATESRTAHWKIGALAEVEADFVLAKAKASISTEFGRSSTMTIGYGAQDVMVPPRSFKRCVFGVTRPTLHGRLRVSWKEPGQTRESTVEPFRVKLPTGPFAEVTRARPL